MKSKIRLVALFVLAAIIGAALIACGGGGEDAAETEEDEMYDLTTISYDAGDFTTNIKDSKKLLISSFRIDLISQKLADILTEKEYIVKDIINKRLIQLTEEDINSPDILDRLSDSLVDSLNEAMNTKGFYKIYITRFAYQ